MPKRSTWLLAATLALTAHAAHAQRPVITENAEEPGRVPYQAFRNVDCTSGDIAVFDTVPPGKRLVVAFVNGSFFPYSGLPGFVNLFGHSGGSFHLPATNVANGGLTMAIVSSPVLAYFDPNETPEIQAVGCALAGANLTISGYFVTLP